MFDNNRVVWLTTEYFTNHQESALIELLTIAGNIYKKKLRKYNLSFDIIDDGVQNLAIELIKSTKQFDPTKNDNFISYVSKCINGEVNKTVLGVKFPFIHSENNKLLYATKYTSQNIPFELIKNKSITKNVYEASKELLAFEHIDIVAENGEPIHVPTGRPSIEDEIDNQRVYNYLMWLISNLSEQDQYILKEIYLRGRTLKQVGDEFKVTHQAIDARIKRIINSLKLMASNSDLAASLPHLDTDFLEI